MSRASPLGTGLRRATRWRLLLLFVAASALPAALATLPAWAFLSGLLDHAVLSGAAAAGLDSSWMPDLLHALAERPSAQGFPVGLLSALAMAVLLAPAIAGAVLSEADSPGRLAFRPLLGGAGSWYGRMLRMALVAALPLGVAAGGGALAVRLARKAGEKAVLESEAVAQGRWALGVVAALLFVAHLTLDAGRAQLAARPSRRSAFLAWVAGAWLVLRRPLRTGAIGVAGAVLGPGLGLAAMAVRERVPGGTGWAVAAGVLLAQVAVAAVGWGRAVRLAALVALARDEAEVRARRKARVAGLAAQAGEPPPPPPPVPSPS